MLKKKLNSVRNLWIRFNIKNPTFTIISNNCWGGNIYNILKIPYNTPTIGLFFFAEDYVEFCRNLKYYLNQELSFISREESKYKESIKKDYPIGIIDNMEIHFLHYKNCEEAEQKWNRRKKRINWDNIILKFSQRDLCNRDCIQQFMDLDYKNKICFSYEKNIKDIIYVPELEDSSIVDETEITLKYFNIIKYFKNR